MLALRGAVLLIVLTFIYATADAAASYDEKFWGDAGAASMGIGQNSKGANITTTGRRRQCDQITE